MRRSLPLAAALILVLSALPASAAPPTRLGEINILEGSSTSAARVRIDSPVTLDLRFSPDDPRARGVQIEGGDDLVGFMLTEDVEPAFSGDTYVVLQLKELAQGRHWTSRPGQCLQCEIDPGDYILYLIIDGAPASVTFELEGGVGNSTFCAPGSCSDENETPLSLVSATQASPTASSDHHLPPAGSVRTSGATGSLQDPGLLLSLTWGEGFSDTVPTAPDPARGPVVLETRYGSCVYDGQPPAFGVQPKCPGGQDTNLLGISVTSVFAPYGYLHSSLLRNVAPGTYTLGAYQVVAGHIDTFGHAALWLESL